MSSAAEIHAHDSHDGDHGAHEGPIRTPRQLVWAIVASFVVPVVIIILLANFVSLGKKEGSGAEAMTAEAVAKRIQRVGSIEVRDVNDPNSVRSGEQVYAAQCASCHASGALNAPKLGDAAAWGPRITAGYAALLQSALKGKGNMPAQGGGEFSDFEIGRAVVHMANKSGGSLPEPKAPAAAASGAGAAAPDMPAASAPAAATAASAPASAASS